MTSYHKPSTKLVPSVAAAALPVPDYLRVHYWWAYVHPKAVRFFERQWLVNLILWGNYNRLRDAALGALGALGAPLRGKSLQIACAYGDITPQLVGRLGEDASLDVVDILPVQLGNLSAKLMPSPQLRLSCMDSAALKFADQSFDQVLLFFLLHEQPADVRAKTLAEAARVLKPGGTMVIVDYAKPNRFHPFRILWKPVLEILEPFATDLFSKGIAHWLPKNGELNIASTKNFFGGVYQVLTVSKACTR
jgi:ubiquinone/menaquinone biosynthesis C-methylase UbiE